jgi:glycosyltransferase involved in cell wall biosynthesis
LSRRRLRLLWVLPFAPRLRGRHGGARVTGQLIDALTERHDVAVLHLAEAGDTAVEDELRSRCALVERVERRPGTRLGTAVRVKAGLLRGIPTWASEVATPGFAERLTALAASWRPDLVQVEYPVMGRYLTALASCPAPRVLVDHDAGLRDLRDFGGPLGGLVGALDARAWRRFERRVMRGVSAVVVFTERDRRALEALGAGTRIVRIPFGVPVSHDAEPDATSADSGRSAGEIVFVGNFRHPANTDAAVWLASTLFPPVLAALPEARLTIVGASPPPEVTALAGDGVTVTGPVEDVSPYVDRAAVVAAPIRLGSGMRVKVLEALAAGRPLVATPLAVEGLDVTSGEQVELASTAPELTAALERLLRDEPARRALGERARAWARDELGWDRVVERYERLYAELGAS